MTRERYDAVCAYMRECMSDAGHDAEHVRRVLGYALDIAEHEDAVDYDLLITACLLHDIGREAQFRDRSLDHAAVGAEMAAEWLRGQGESAEFCERVRRTIRAHRYRTGEPADSIEAKILFDADKLDVCGIMGLFRTISYADTVRCPYYTLNEKGEVDMRADAPESVFQEYCFKLSKVDGRFYTGRAREIAARLAPTMKAAFDAGVAEVNAARAGLRRLDEIIEG